MNHGMLIVDLNTSTHNQAHHSSEPGWVLVKPERDCSLVQGFHFASPGISYALILKATSLYHFIGPSWFRGRHWLLKPGTTYP